MKKPREIFNLTKKNVNCGYCSRIKGCLSTVFFCPEVLWIKIVMYNYNDYYTSLNANIQRQSYPSNKLTDYAPNPFVVDINKATIHNNTFRTALWTGNHLQVTLMSIPVGENIGLEVHPNVDQGNRRGC